MNKIDKFKQDYETVMEYWMGLPLEIEDINEIVLSSKYFNKYKYEMKTNGQDILYIESFLDYFEKHYDAVLELGNTYKMKLN